MRQFVFPLQAVLAGIILSNVVPYLEAIYNLPSLWRQDQYECVSTDASSGCNLGVRGAEAHTHTLPHGQFPGLDPWGQ